MHGTKLHNTYTRRVSDHYSADTHQLVDQNIRHKNITEGGKVKKINALQ